MEMYDIKDYIVTQFRPLCVVFATPQAAQLCADNGLSPAELLRPFADLRKEQVIFRANSTSAYVLKDFVVDMCDGEEFQSPELHLKARTRALVNAPPCFPVALGACDSKQTTSAAAMVDVKELQLRRTPWFEIWKKAFIDLGEWPGVEGIYRPIAYLYLASTDEQIVESINAVREEEVPKILLLLAPNNAQSLARVGVAYEAARQSLPDFSLYLAPINSRISCRGYITSVVKFNGNTCPDNIWTPYLRIYNKEISATLGTEAKSPTADPGKAKGRGNSDLGKYISVSERAKLQDLMIEIIRSLVLPKCETRLQELVAHTQPKRYSFFGSEDTSGTDPEKTDSDLRKAADLAFLFQNYYGAAGLYGRLFDRLKKGTAYAEIGSCKEFLTLAELVVAEYSRKDFVRNMESAGEFYARAGAWDLFVRNVLFTQGILALDLALYLERAAEKVPKESEAAALLLEQAAYAVIKADPPRLRLFAKHMFAAGEVYLDRGLLNNCVHSLGISYCLYEKSEWPELLARLYCLLGRAFERLQDVPKSYWFYKKLLELTIASPYLAEYDHAETLQQFLTAASRLKRTQTNCAEGGEQKEFAVHSLIQVCNDSFELFAPQDRLCSNTRDPLKCEEERNLGKYNRSQTWLSLGKMLDGDLSGVNEKSKNPKQKAREERLRDLTFWDETVPRRRVFMYTRKRRFVHAMEPIYLKFRCRNAISIRVVGRYLKRGTDETAQKAGIQQKEDTPPMSVTFEAGETREITLSLLLREQGEFAIEGVEWEAGGILWGRYDISGATGRREPIVLTVRPKAGQLAISADRHLRLEYLDGELDRYVLKLKNTGYFPVSQIVFQTDYPIFFGWKTIALDWVLEPLEEREFPVCIHASIPGPAYVTYITSAKMLVRYSTFNTELESSYQRYARVQHVYSVIPSFNIQSNSMRSAAGIDEYMLNLQIDELRVKADEFSLEQVSVVSNFWKIQEKTQLPGLGHFLNLFLSLTKTVEPVTDLSQKRVLIGSTPGAEKSSGALSPSAAKAEATNDNSDQDGESGSSKGEATTASFVESNVNHIKEYQESKQKGHHSQKQAVDLVAVWTLKCDQHTSKGAHMFSVMLEAQPGRNKEDELESKFFPLHVVRICPQRVVHDFSHFSYDSSEATPSRECKIPLILEAKNMLDHSVSFKFEVSATNPKRIPPLFWQGAVTRSAELLAPGMVTRIELKACVSRPGVYDLNRFVFKFFRDMDTGKEVSTDREGTANTVSRSYRLEDEQIVVIVEQADCGGNAKCNN